MTTFWLLTSSFSERAVDARAAEVDGQWDSPRRAARRLAGGTEVSRSVKLTDLGSVAGRVRFPSPTPRVLCGLPAGGVAVFRCEPASPSSSGGVELSQQLKRAPARARIVEDDATAQLAIAEANRAEVKDPAGGEGTIVDNGVGHPILLG